MNQFYQVIQNLGAGRITAIVGAAAVVLGTLIFVLTRLNTPDLALLYAELDPSDADQIVAELSAQNVPFELRGQGDQILVPQNQVGQLRLAMAQLGLPTSGTVGYEIFDREQAIGTSSFVQEVNQLRALEGELARTIASLAPVKGARVHLVLPRRELFTRERQDPSASVILRMKGVNRLDRSQVLAVQHLVAAAVPRLKPSAISIVDDRGTLLARGGDDEQAGLTGQTADEMRASYETRLARRLESLLENTVGIGKVRAEVRAVMDFSQQVVEEEEFNPEGQVLRSSESIEESAFAEDGAADNVTVEQNLPDAPGDPDGGGSREQSSRTEERSNFEINRRATNTIIAPGRIQQLSVALLVDGHYRAAEDGTTTYEARSSEEMEQIEKLARSAIGFGADGRDDVVEVVNMQFADITALVGEDESEIFGFPTAELLRYAEKFVLAALFILVLLMIVRPILARLMEAGPSALAEATGIGGGDLMLADESGMAGAPQLAAPGAAPSAPGMPAVAGEDGGGDMDENAEEFEAMIDIAQVEGRVKASSLRKIGEIIEKHPEEAVSILRTWISQDA